MRRGPRPSAGAKATPLDTRLDAATPDVPDIYMRNAGANSHGR
jgi:hypothetical protein